MDVWQWYVRRGRISRSIYLVQYLLPFLLTSIAAAWADRLLDLPRVAMVVETGRFILEPAGLLEQWVFVAWLVPGVSAVAARLRRPRLPGALRRDRVPA